jgi:hypothetical protein
MIIQYEDFKKKRNENNNRINSVKASSVERVPVKWLWKNRLACGKLTLLGGDPSMGKSQIGIDIIARITRGKDWCDGDGAAPKGNCIILSAEDASNDTICPRLDAAGADSDRIHIIQSVLDNGAERSMNLKDDLERLEAKLAEIGNVVLIMIDPITAYLGDKIDSHQTTAVRNILEPLSRFAEKNEICILAITHPPKAMQQKAIQTFTGSLAFVAAARIALLAIEDVEDSDGGPVERRLLLGVKNNLGPLPDGIGYSIQGATIGDGIETCHIEWDNDPVDITANEAIRAAKGTTSASKLQEAEDFLNDCLKNGEPVAAETVYAKAEQQGLSTRTLKRAKEKIGIISQKNGFFGGGWTWKLPY